MKYKVDFDSIKEVQEMGYQVKVFTWWHYRIYSKMDDKFIDVFPTKKTYLINIGNRYTSKKKNYIDFTKLVETELDKAI